jgi:hypothetical protein
MRSSERGGAVMFNLNTLIGSTTEAILVAGNHRALDPYVVPAQLRAGAVPTLAGPTVCGAVYVRASSLNSHYELISPIRTDSYCTGSLRRCREAIGFGEDGVSGFGLDEGFGVIIVLLEITVDGAQTTTFRRRPALPLC